MEQQELLNAHNKKEYPPMHTCEHIVNQTMIRIFHCERSVSAHIERKKSKLDYILPSETYRGTSSIVRKKCQRGDCTAIDHHYRIYHTIGSSWSI